jgi:TonB family protein
MPRTRFVFVAALAAAALLCARPAAAQSAAAADSAGAVADTYELTQVTERPQLQNAGDVRRALIRAYTDAMRDKGLTGSVTLLVRIQADGQVDTAHVTELATDAPDLVPAARKVVAVMRFSPAKRDGHPVAVWAPLPVNFVLATAPTP